jgi:hypothetical protein
MIVPPVPLVAPPAALLAPPPPDALLVLDAPPVLAALETEGEPPDALVAPALPAVVETPPAPLVASSAAAHATRRMAPVATAPRRRSPLLVIPYE